MMIMMRLTLKIIFLNRAWKTENLLGCTCVKKALKVLKIKNDITSKLCLG